MPMAENAEGKRTLSVLTYFEREAASSVRHEYVAGVLHPRHEVSKRHNRVAGNVARLLGMQPATVRAGCT